MREIDRLPAELRRPYEAFRALFDRLDGAAISQRDRHVPTAPPPAPASADAPRPDGADAVEDGEGLTYGEVEFGSFVSILRRAAAPSGAVFYDLGCGTGKVRERASRRPAPRGSASRGAARHCARLCS